MTGTLGSFEGDLRIRKQIIEKIFVASSKEHTPAIIRSVGVGF